MIRIKLCGLTRPEDIIGANELLPDYIGFVFWNKSSRYVDEDKARKLKDMLDHRIRAVGVFVDEDIDVIMHLMREGIIDAVQLHGSEDEDYIRRLREGLEDGGGPDRSDHSEGIRIIKAFKVRSEEDIRIAAKSGADMVLLDAGRGDGLAFDWELCAGMTRPYILAGGLDCDNILQAVKMLSPYGVDVSSGIETAGKKDQEKMKDFVSIIRNR